jgi:hypothetical protein
MSNKATHDALYDEADEVAGEATDAQNRTLLKVLPVLLLVAVALTGGGLYFAAFQVDLLLNGETATGEVIALEAGTSTSSSSRPAYFPIVAFEAPDGSRITFRHRTGQSPPAYAEGDSVTVTYLPDDPEAALIAEGFMNWLLPLVLLAIGPGLSFVALRGILGARRRLVERPWPHG